MNHTVNPPGASQATGYVRLAQVLGQKAVTAEQAAANKLRGKGSMRPRPATAPIVPVSHATLWRWVKAGTFPAPVKLGDRVTAWRIADVQRFLASQGGAA